MEREFLIRALGLGVVVCVLLVGARLVSRKSSSRTCRWALGNVADTRVMNDGTTGDGAVNYIYNIGEYAVTAGQYTAFLNAVAKTDPDRLYLGIGRCR